MIATAPPPTPLNSATICGIAVIRTFSAAGIPTAVPITSPTMISPGVPEPCQTPGVNSVAITAIVIPPAAILLPPTAVRGPVSPLIAVDEHRERDDVQRVDEVRLLQEDRREITSPPPPVFGGSLRLNMSSIRSVTKKPPITLIVPNAIAITSSRCSRNPWASCISSRPPSSTIP